MTDQIPQRESLTVEFKSDRDRLADRELVAAVVCLANTEGGDIFVGVEDDGSVTGLHPAHQNPARLGALIANQTSPPVSVRVETLDIEGTRIVKISVPKARQLVATAEGLLQRRRLKADGLPECVPLYPHEIAQRQSDLGRLDYSALPVAGAESKDFDPLERERLRQFVERYGGDRSLVGLADEELDGALGLVSFESMTELSTQDVGTVTNTNKGGRPTKVPGGFRQVLRIRLTDAERAEYQKAADRAGVPLSQWVRGCLGKAAGRGMRDER